MASGGYDDDIQDLTEEQLVRRIDVRPELLVVSFTCMLLTFLGSHGVFD